MSETAKPPVEEVAIFLVGALMGVMIASVGTVALAIYAQFSVIVALAFLAFNEVSFGVLGALILMYLYKISKGR